MLWKKLRISMREVVFIQSSCVLKSMPLLPHFPNIYTHVLKKQYGLQNREMKSCYVIFYIFVVVKWFGFTKKILWFQPVQPLSIT